ncbi:MAG: hypothetical protein V7749_05885 [Cocleimonas sp.]
MEKQKIIQTLRIMAAEGKKPSEMLRYLVLDIGEQQQIELMLLFTQAFDVTLGEVTAIGGWWHDDSAELNDADIDAYISPLIKV